jgi:uncharacterized membrane protein YfcA
MARERWLKLAATGTAAGLFSGLFGVGGGTVIVPLLVLWLGYDQRTASGTSLAAIAVIAVMAVAVQGVAGNVEPRQGLEVGIPALAGVLVGTRVQQVVPVDVLSLLFALLLLAVAADLVLP